MSTERWIGAALVTTGATVAALYLAGYLVLVLLGLDTALLGIGTWYAYASVVDHPQVAPHAWRIWTAGGIGFGLMGLVWLALVVMLFKLRSHRNIHGRARFAGMLDLANKGLLKHRDDGIVLGQMNGKLLRLSGQQFVILAAPTRSGKGVGVVIPNLLDYRESAVVLDIKQENFDLTSGWRQSIGHEIFLFNPFAEDRRSHRWNPMTYVSSDPSFRVSDLQAIAAMLYPDGDDRDKFWTSQARNAFLAFTLYLFERADHVDDAPTPTLGEVLRLSSGDGSELKPYLQTLSEAPFLGAQARTAFAGLLSQADVTFASIMGSFREPLNAWLNPVLDAATSGDDFRLDDVRRKRMTIYVGIQPNKLAESRLIVNLFFSQLINVNTRTLPQNDASLKHQCLLLMDELTSIGRVDIIAKAVAYMAGYNLRLLPIIQSMAQLDAVYGKELSRTIITNHALQIIYAPREQQDANDYSEMLGYTTVRRRARTRSHGQGRSVSDNEVLEKRALMLPQELKAMGPEKEIVIYEGLAHPVLCKKIRYYKDSYFTKRLLEKVPVKPLPLSEDKSVKGKTASILAASTIALLSACANPQAQESPATPREQHQNHELADDQAATAEQALEDAMRKTASERDALRAANTPRPPGPAADFPPAPTVPPITADKLRADILRLIESIRTPDDTNREHVDRIMGVTMGKDEDTDMQFAYRGTTEEGWIYGVQVRPERDNPGSRILIWTAPKGISERRPEQCTYDFEAFAAELETLGYQRHAERP